ncbi:DUF5067 domain-containing protein [Staphylococcus hyicus]|uniref:DUF5067 domain-containing protein n=1 Tax=Staphylococcus hyicus TaxID=1284 RepID=A0A418JHB8_STAHY|nr:DUF5067 domain-containing protein [Staphylococcus hyicus]MCQ9291205.1 DUF5067 domain-containing protein [Staphylococcus hyicus]MCQ9300079.1 DUF5067 domain-containing protein [Staphylococcus hyicus]MCQ9306446.1 DUF5067 domain-containing protein [Staphylococcus hyicus]MCQ9308859.1 DUF5067 domain-containing protein [Staphylococcus hyicus]MCQ9311280.1 DUF5067 domain-containing protein [Staphylococcus hyicus]
MKKIFSALCVSSLLLSGCGLIGNGKDDKKEAEENIGNGYFKADTLKTKEAEFKLKKPKLVEQFNQDDKRGPYIVFEYEYTNKSKENMSAQKAWGHYFEFIKDTKDTEERIHDTYVTTKDGSKYSELKENGDLLVKPKDNVKAMAVYPIKKEPVKLLLKGHTKRDDSEPKALGEKVIHIEK